MCLKRLKRTCMSAEMDQKCQIADRSNQKNIYNVYLNKITVDVSEDEDMRKLRLRRQAAKGLYYSTMHDYRPEEVVKLSLIMKPLMRAAKSHKTLKSITIDVENYGNVNDQSLKYMSKCLKYLALLQKVDIVFDDCGKVSNEGMRSLGQGLKHLASLRHVNLGIIEGNKVTSIGWRHFGQYLKSLSSLQKIEFNFDACSIVDKALKQSLKCFVSLNSINLKFTEYGAQIITNKGLKYLGECLKPLIFLQNVELEFNTRKFSNKGIGYLCDGLRCLTALQRLTLIFGCAESLQAQMPKKLDDIGLQALGECLKHLISLQNVKLLFSECSMSNEGLEFLSESLSHLTLIKQINITFDACPGVSKQECEDFKKRLKSLKS